LLSDLGPILTIKGLRETTGEREILRRRNIGGKTLRPRLTVLLCLVAVLVFGTGLVQVHTDLQTDLNGIMDFNTLYLGDWNDAYQNKHQFDHQVCFTPLGARILNGTTSMANANLSQANTGLRVGDQAGAVSGSGSVGVSYQQAQWRGGSSSTSNLGGVGQNQGITNLLNAFSGHTGSVSLSGP
jgi:hypothetical protein